MLVFFTRHKKTVRYHESSKNDISQYHYGIVEDLLNMIGIDIINNDRELEKNNVVFIEDFFDVSIEVARKPLYQLKNSQHSIGKDTHVFLDNRSEPRNFNLSNFLYTAKYEYGIDEKNIHVITATKHHIYKDSKVNVYYFPYFSKVFLLEGDYRENVKITKKVKTKLVSSFNRRTTIQRILQVSDIIKNFNPDEYTISLGVDETSNSPKKNHHLLKVLSGNPEIEYPLIVDKEQITTEDNTQFKTEIGDSSNTIFEIVNETIPTTSDVGGTNSMHGGVYYLTEKTLRPFLNHQIPIINTTTGFTKWLHKNYGFDLFKDIIDYTKWDNLPTLEGRSEVIITEIKRFKSKYPDYNKFYHDNLFRFQLNEAILRKFDTNHCIKIN